MKRWHIEPDGTGYFDVTAPDGDYGPEENVWVWEFPREEMEAIREALAVHDGWRYRDLIAALDAALHGKQGSNA